MRKHQQGVALIEFALILPLLLVLTFITIDIGRAVFRYNTTAKTVRDAVRYISVWPENTHVTEMRNLIVYGNTAGTGDPMDPALTSSMVLTPTYATVGSNPVIRTVTVTVEGYTFTPMFADFFGVTAGTVTFSNISATMRSPL